jgi:enamine deaminase RidA (YjgF/YER057c/UK114 family)
MYSTTGDAVEDFTEELYRVLPDVPWGWDKISVLVPETAKYVAINYRSYDLCYVYIDDIELRDTLQRDTTYVYVHDTLYYAAADTVVVTVRDTQFVSPHYYEVLVFADEPERGTVIGSGVFPEGTVVEIAAIANEGYVFERWSDGRLDNPRRVRVNDDVLMSAFFVADSGTGGGTMTQFFHDTLIVRDTIWLLNPNENPFVRYEHTPFEYDSTVYCTLTALSADAERGLVAGGGRFPRGTMVEVGALALPGYDFWRWEDNSTENPRTVAVVGDMTVRAFFKAEGPEEVTEAEGNRAKIFARGSRLVVELEKAEPVAVYTILGQEIYQAPTPQRRTQLNGLRRGIYLVKVGERAARKVVVLGE